MSVNFNMDVTSANAVLILAVDELFPSGFQLQNFTADNIFSVNDMELAEVRMGADGKIAAGYTPVVKNVTINLEACSPSYANMASIAAAMQANRKIYVCTLTARLDSIHRRVTWSKGVLQTGTFVPSAKRTLDPTTWTFAFQDVEYSVI